MADAIEAELARGPALAELWDDFARRSRAAIDGLRAWLDERRAAGRIVAGYGAAAKGNTLMNAAGVARDDLVARGRRQRGQAGQFLPGTHVPVVAPDRPAAHGADDVLILPWNIAAEISRICRRPSCRRPRLGRRPRDAGPRR